MTDPQPLYNFFAKSGGGKANYIGREIDRFFLPMFKSLLAEKYLTQGFFRVLEFKVGPSIDFDAKEGPHKLRAGKGGLISIDFDIPMSAWVGKTQSEYRDYYADGMEKCFQMLHDKAMQHGQLKDRANLERSVEENLAALREHDFGDWFWGAELAE